MTGPVVPMNPMQGNRFAESMPNYNNFLRRRVAPGVASGAIHPPGNYMPGGAPPIQMGGGGSLPVQGATGLSGVTPYPGMPIGGVPPAQPAPVGVAPGGFLPAPGRQRMQGQPAYPVNGVNAFAR